MWANLYTGINHFLLKILLSMDRIPPPSKKTPHKMLAEMHAKNCKKDDIWLDEMKHQNWGREIVILIKNWENKKTALKVQRK
jgi:hypothetical protein